MKPSHHPTRGPTWKSAFTLLTALWFASVVALPAADSRPDKPNLIVKTQK